MEILLTYDVDRKQPEVKKALENGGYGDRWKAGDTIYYLPNSTLWHKDRTVKDAISDIETVCASLNVILERAIAVPTDPWAGIPGKKHS